MAENLNQEQTPPADGTGPDCWELVLADMRERRLVGIEKYGKPVRPDNGRDALTDAYQEALDQCVYLRQAIEQKRATTAEVERLRGVAEANLAMSADLIAMEGTIKDLRHELSTLKEGTYCAYCGFTVASDADGSVVADHIRTCERHPMRDVEAENERLRTTLASIEEYGTEEINAGIELRQENERLRAMQRYAPKAGWGCWKWLSEFEEHIRCPEVLPRPMFDSLRGYDELESSSSSRAYLSREDAMNALQTAFDAVAKQQQQQQQQ